MSMSNMNMNNTANYSTTSFISLFTHEKDGRRFVSGTFTAASGESLVAFAFPGLQKEWLVRRESKAGTPYVCTRVPVRIAFNASSDIADIVSIEMPPEDTQTLNMVDSLLK